MLADETRAEDAERRLRGQTCANCRNMMVCPEHSLSDGVVSGELVRRCIADDRKVERDEWCPGWRGFPT